MKKIISTSNAPAAIGPYCQATTFKDLIFTSGQLPLIPEIGVFPEGGIKEQSRQSLNNLKAILEAAGSSMDCILKTTCYLKDINDFAAFNEVYAEMFGPGKAPARSCFAVACLPKDALIEVEAIAHIKG